MGFLDPDPDPGGKKMDILTFLYILFLSESLKEVRKALKSNVT